MCRYCREFLEQVTVSVVANGKVTVRWSDAICSGVQVNSLLVPESLALSRTDLLCGQIYCFSHKFSSSGISLIVAFADPCNSLCNADTRLFLPANYDDLYQWSVENYSDFWAEFWKYSNIVCSRLYDEVSPGLILQPVQHKEEINWCYNQSFDPFLGTLGSDMSNWSSSEFPGVVDGGVFCCWCTLGQWNIEFYCPEQFCCSVLVPCAPFFVSTCSWGFCQCISFCFRIVLVEYHPDFVNAGILSSSCLPSLSQFW